jgi:hypothetical protein
MQFQTPRGDRFFQIADDWWRFADMGQFSPEDGGGYYPYPSEVANVHVLPLRDIEPPMRAPGLEPFKKYKLLPVLFAFGSPEGQLPPVHVVASHADPAYPYRLTNGFHRFFASVAAGYTSIPALICERFVA